MSHYSSRGSTRTTSPGGAPVQGKKKKYDLASPGPGSKKKIITGSAISNPTSTSKMNLIKCRRPMFVKTFNVRTLNGQARQGEITAMSEKYQIDVTCIQEHRIHHPEETVKHQDLGNGWTIITSSAEKAENNATIRGVGVWLANEPNL